MSTITYLSVSVKTEPPSCPCDDAFSPRRKLPAWLIDKMAEEKVTGKFKTARKNLCGVCHLYRSVNGSCGCPE